MSRVVEYNGLAWFSGHSSPGQKTLKEQAKALAARYDDLFDQFGYNKENIVMSYGFVRDIEQYEEFEEPMRSWRSESSPPAGVLVEAVPCGDTNQLELQLIVSLDD